MQCPKCKSYNRDEDQNCVVCGAALTAPTNYSTQYSPPVTVSSKNRVTAGILAILLGGIGVHKFYLGKIGMGIVFILFSWTGIPLIIGIVEGIIYLTMTDQAFAEKFPG